MTQPQKPETEKIEVVQNFSGDADVDTVIGVVNGDVNIDVPGSIAFPGVKNVKIYLPNSIILLISLISILAAAAVLFLIFSRPNYAFEPAKDGELLVILTSFSGGSKDAEFDPLRILRDPIQTRLDRMGMVQGEKIRLEEWSQPISTTRQARELGEKYGATLVIWGEFDDVIGVRTYVEIMKEVPQPDAQQSGNLLPVAPLLIPVEQATEIGRVPINCLIDDLPHQGDYLTTLSMGILQLTHHDFAQASELFSQSLQVANASANGLCTIQPQSAYYWRGLNYGLQEDYLRALADFDHALVIQPDFILALVQRGNVNISMGNPMASQQDYQSALALLYPEDSLGRAALLGNIGLTYELLGQADDAESNYRDALKIHEVANLPGPLALDWLHLGSLALRKNQKESAYEFLNRSLGFYKDAKDQHGQAVVLGNLGLIKYQQGEYLEAVQFFDQAVSISQKTGDKNGESRQLVRIAQVYLIQNDTVTAQKYLEQALALSKQTGSPYGQAMAYLGLGMTAYQLENFPEARANLQEAFDLLSAINSPDAETVQKVLSQLK